MQIFHATHHSYVIDEHHPSEFQNTLCSNKSDQWHNNRVGKVQIKSKSNQINLLNREFRPIGGPRVQGPIVPGKNCNRLQILGCELHQNVLAAWLCLDLLGSYSAPVRPPCHYMGRGGKERVGNVG